MAVVLIVVLVALVSLLITRAATLALTATGMPRSVARFQARSALSGVGYTTTEAESVVNHPTRRRIVMMLMLVGNAGLVTAVAGLLAGYSGSDGLGEGAERTLVLVAGLVAVYLLSLSRAVDRRLGRLLTRLLRRYTDLEVSDLAGLLHVSGDYAVVEIAVVPGDWLTHGSLGALRLRDEGILVLGIVRADGTYLGTPDRDTCIAAGDIVVVYGRSESLAGLSQRRADDAGRRDHDVQVAEADEVARDERRTDDG